MPISVLVAEDNRNVALSLQLLFASHGINCEVVINAYEALELIKLHSCRYDLLILDLMLPDESGLDLMIKLKTIIKTRIPILVLSGRHTTEDKIKGLGLGADDYLSKPFNRKELLARVYALVRRSKGHAASALRFDGMCINLDTRTVEVNGKLVPTTDKEYEIIELLAMRCGHVVDKKALLNHLYGGINVPEPKIIDVFTCKLRRKLYVASGGKNFIDTVWGKGYMLRRAEETPAVAKDRACHQTTKQPTGELAAVD